MLLKSSEIFGTPRYLIMDPVHGGISYFEHEKKVIDHPLFQRLRHIKQNDILHFVFPGATHSRLEHSFGAMHIAGRIYKSMILNYLIKCGGKAISSAQIDSIQYCYGCLRLATLLHDLGHMPFSHQFEQSDAGKNLLKDKETKNSIWSSQLFGNEKLQPEFMTHEHYSIWAAFAILDELQKNGELPVEICDVIGMMEKSRTSPSERFCNDAARTLKLLVNNPVAIDMYDKKEVGETIQTLFKNIISGEIDADKMDYLLRDSYFSGCNYGVYNLDHLIQNICVGYDITTNPKVPWVGLALKIKGLGALEDLIHSRFRMYLQVYNHKTVVGLKWLVGKAVAEILKNNDCRKAIEHSLMDTSGFSSFTDTFFWEEFRKEACRSPNSACSDLIDRSKPIHVGETNFEALFQKKQIMVKYEKKLKKKIFSYESSSRFSKITPSFDTMRLLIKDPITKEEHLDAITTRSSFFNKFKDNKVTHFYIQPTWDK